MITSAPFVSLMIGLSPASTSARTSSQIRAAGRIGEP